MANRYAKKKPSATKEGPWPQGSVKPAALSNPEDFLSVIDDLVAHSGRHMQTYRFIIADDFKGKTAEEIVGEYGTKPVRDKPHIAHFRVHNEQAVIQWQYLGRNSPQGGAEVQYRRNAEGQLEFDEVTNRHFEF